MLIIQLTGLSGSGKTTLSLYVKNKLAQSGLVVEIIDGDKYRETLCSDLGFSKADRCENIRRLGRLASAFTTADVVIIAAINPFDEVRNELLADYDAKIVWINCEIDTLISRDTKGLYKRALLPESHPDKLNNLTGVNDQYDKPQNCAFTINTHNETAQQSGDAFYRFILTRLGL